MNSKKLIVTLPEDGYETLVQIAEDQGRPMADVIRTALSEYATAQGYDINVKVNRGGERERPKKSEVVDTSVLVA